MEGLFAILFIIFLKLKKASWRFISLIVEELKGLHEFRQMPCSISFSLVVEELKGLWMLRQMPCSVSLITIFRRFNSAFYLSVYQLFTLQLTY